MLCSERNGKGRMEKSEALKILYASVLTENDSSLYRMWALKRAGQTVVPFNALEYVPKQPLIHKLTFRLSAGP